MTHVGITCGVSVFVTNVVPLVFKSVGSSFEEFDKSCKVINFRNKTLTKGNDIMRQLSGLELAAVAGGDDVQVVYSDPQPRMTAAEKAEYDYQQGQTAIGIDACAQGDASAILWLWEFYQAWRRS